MGTDKSRVMPAPGSRVATICMEDGWHCASEYGDRWFYVENCMKMAEKLFGCKNACILCVVTQGAPKGREAEWALAYCSKKHTVNSPEHALLPKRAEFIAAMDDTMTRYQPKRRQAAIASGKIVGSKPTRGGGRGRGRGFGRQTARSQ